MPLSQQAGTNSRSRFVLKAIAGFPAESSKQKLLSETELLDNSSVSFDILLCEVVKELLSVTNHLGKTSLRMEVLGVLLHMLGKAIDSISKNSYLNLGRTGVLLVDLVLSDDGGFCFL